ncbi:MAG TPA: tRNA lysidine(34) synthetase TilS [Methyloceanibacter sp.]|nr:tRNA lysidine(34) synthetase TilS [Methyloceanibacter sp.]
MSTLPISPSESRRLFALLAPFPHAALAVSGGPDSLALMLLAARWRDAREDGPKLSVLTVDHGLRSGARAEAEQVGRLASALGLPHKILTWEKNEPPPASLQAKARTARYDLMAAYCHAHGIPALVTAHTQDDQAETFLMRLKRGSGLDGLAAIPERGAWAGISVLRPLLDAPKARLIATLDAAGLSYVTDPSNADPRFERARMRARASALEAFGLSPEALALSARRLRRAREALDGAACDFLVRHGAMSAAGYATIDREALAAAPQEIALRALAQVIAAVGGGEAPVQLAKLEALLAALEANPDKAHTLGRCRLQPVSGRLGFFREVRSGGLPVAKLRPGERALWDNRFAIELGADEPESLTVKALGDEGFQALRERSDAVSALPRLAGRTLPACWRGEVLLGLPQLGLPGSRAPFVAFCRARFVSVEPADFR